MTVPQRHITAGDLTPVTIQTESTYGTGSGTDILYGDVAEGGNFTFKDTANPYINWRYGSRSFDPSDYVTQQKDAGFSASLEVRDDTGWGQIITHAVGTGDTTVGDPVLPSRTEEIYVVDGNKWRGRTYSGCKTNKLTISADAPGGVVRFEEEVLASKSTSAMLNAAKAIWTTSPAPAVQWMNGITVSGNDIYPQSFKLTITNNLDRVRVPNGSGDAITGALLEGRREIEIEADVWMEDLSYIANAINNSNITGSVVITLGIDYPVTLTLSGCKYMADGTLPSLIQDKQRQTIRMRAANLVMS